ncbi:hypothetical protein [Arthrobacter sp. UYEF3]|uniref:hypothetical protein n=1 Tax=Arthrobacter sp. UYEF3 TaxID=1756365 RepID=UPI0033948A78
MVTGVCVHAESRQAPADRLIREATGHDWPAIWEILEPVIRAGETFARDRDTIEDRARAKWIKTVPGRTFVAVRTGEFDGVVLGTGGPRAVRLLAGGSPRRRFPRPAVQRRGGKQ